AVAVRVDLIARDCAAGALHLPQPVAGIEAVAPGALLRPRGGDAVADAIEGVLGAAVVGVDLGRAPAAHVVLVRGPYAVGIGGAVQAAPGQVGPAAREAQGAALRGAVAGRIQ